MHITIFGITSDIDNIEDGLSSSIFDDDDYARYHYDYWTDIEQAPGSIALDFASMFGSVEDGSINVSQDDHGWYIQFTQKAIDQYFHEMFLDLWPHLCDLMKTTEPDMKRYDLMPLVRAKAAWSDEYGDMVFSWDDGWQTPQDFMRFVKPETKYYICGAVDAHI